MMSTIRYLKILADNSNVNLIRLSFTSTLSLKFPQFFQNRPPPTMLGARLQHKPSGDRQSGTSYTSATGRHHKKKLNLLVLCEDSLPVLLLFTNTLCSPLSNRTFFDNDSPTTFSPLNPYQNFPSHAHLTKNSSPFLYLLSILPPRTPPRNRSTLSNPASSSHQIRQSQSLVTGQFSGLHPRLRPSRAPSSTFHPLLRQLQP